MYRSSVLSIALAAAAATAGLASAEPRVAMTDPAPAFEPGALVARYQALGARVVGTLARVADPGWVIDVSTAIGDSVHALGASSRAWIVGVFAPLAPTPPDLTALTAYPVPDRTSSGFGWRDDPINHRDQFHAGADIHAPRGTPVHAAGDGQVVFAGRQHGYGNIIYVDHGHGLITRYAHLSKIGVAKGDVVMAAQEIGKVGATGRATGPHLHFEVRIDGAPVAPQLAMQVAELERTQPDVARLAALALAPDVQAHWINEQDPPRRHGETRTHQKPKGQRPERRGRTPRDHLNS
jgi:murein DD-endopeptidase MepM/ murein hydrolase activator NlpD